MHACSATINLFNDIEVDHKESFSKVTKKYEASFIQQLIKLLSNSELRIQKAAVTAFASLAEHMGIFKDTFCQNIDTLRYLYGRLH